mmetsp:Transcript_17788/g.38086  ORF Transcript_17788/g.38086 Transcript_17788/m.38086 type:complete len:118 (-) Transcript_17788:132-485(-)
MQSETHEYADSNHGRRDRRVGKSAFEWGLCSYCVAQQQLPKLEIIYSAKNRLSWHPVKCGVKKHKGMGASPSINCKGKAVTAIAREWCTQRRRIANKEKTAGIELENTLCLSFSSLR